MKVPENQNKKKMTNPKLFDGLFGGFT